MTFEEALALQPAWVGLWLNWLLFGAFILPLALLISLAFEYADVLRYVLGNHTPAGLPA